MTRAPKGALVVREDRLILKKKPLITTKHILFNDQRMLMATEVMSTIYS